MALPFNPSDRRFELETVVRFDETGEPALLWTASKRVADKLIKAGLAPTKLVRHKGETTGWWFALPTYGIVVKPTTKAIRIGIKKRPPKPEDLDQSDDEIVRGSAARAEKVLPDSIPTLPRLTLLSPV